MPLFLALALFAVFALNVSLGSFRGAVFLGDVGEMLVLMAAAVMFVVAILKREAAEKARNGGK